MLGFLFAADGFAVDPDDAQKMLNEQGLQVVRAASAAVADLRSSPPTRSSPRCVLRPGGRDGHQAELAFGPVR